MEVIDLTGRPKKKQRRVPTIDLTDAELTEANGHYQMALQALDTVPAELKERDLRRLYCEIARLHSRRHSKHFALAYGAAKQAVAKAVGSLLRAAAQCEALRPSRHPLRARLWRRTRPAQPWGDGKPARGLLTAQLSGGRAGAGDVACRL